jgi:hypothetical protein
MSRTEEGGGANRAKLGPSQAFLQIGPSKKACGAKNKNKNKTIYPRPVLSCLVLANGAAPH